MHDKIIIEALRNCTCDKNQKIQLLFKSMGHYAIAICQLVSITTKCRDSQAQAKLNTLLPNLLYVWGAK